MRYEIRYMGFPPVQAGGVTKKAALFAAFKRLREQGCRVSWDAFQRTAKVETYFSTPARFSQVKKGRL